MGSSEYTTKADWVSLYVPQPTRTILIFRLSALLYYSYLLSPLLVNRAELSVHLLDSTGRPESPLGNINHSSKISLY